MIASDDIKVREGNKALIIPRIKKIRMKLISSDGEG